MSMFSTILMFLYWSMHESAPSWKNFFFLLGSWKNFFLQKIKTVKKIIFFLKNMTMLLMPYSKKSIFLVVTISQL